ncbi:MAG: HlyD family secretion protein, partial [Victivallaceae bacterium]|nr:HlyD family secretion protein [Victivallaceae bacterium]
YCFLHYKPFTQNAFVIANTRPVSPLVEGYLTSVAVRNHQRVKKGDPLFTVFRPPYELAVRQLEFLLAETRAKLAGVEASLKVARAQVEKAVAESKNRDYLAAQAAAMYAKAAISQTYSEEAARAAEAAAAALKGAIHSVEVLEKEREALAAACGGVESKLALARIYLEQTTVYALADGIISNMYVSPGGYYRPGDVLFGFIEDGEWWIQANFEETDLSTISPGQNVEIWLWQYPGKTFHGVVESVLLGAERRVMSPLSGVQVVAKENQWFLLPQRFPVQIRITDVDQQRYPMNLGGSAFVQVDTSSQLFKQIIWRVFRWR